MLLGIVGVVLLMMVVSVAAYFVGTYMFRVFTGRPVWGDRVLNPVESLLFRLGGVDPKRQMTWKQYYKTILLLNLPMGLLAYLLLRIQTHLPLNPDHQGVLAWPLAFNTAASFLANCNWQAYSGEQTLSYFSQMAAIIFLQFTTPATGLIMAIGFIRALGPKRETIGNMYSDFVKALTRVLIPLSFVCAVVLVAAGLPATLAGAATAHTLEGAVQTISRGPVAALEAIKQFGTNGGGFFNANSAHPFENPSWFTNLIEIFAMSLLPTSLVFTFGRMVDAESTDRIKVGMRQAWVLFGVTMALLLACFGLVYHSELAGNPALAHALGVRLAPNMEGHEVRFGQTFTALFVTNTTAYTTGAVNAMHDSLTPLAGGTALLLMMLNAVFGGKGVGLVNMLMFLIITVFVSGLMVGRTPQFLGKKIESREIRLATVAMLIHPVIILFPAAFALIHKVGTASLANPGLHGFSEILYAFTSAAADNGSAFAGLNANTPFYDLSLGLVILIGRYLSVAAMFALAGSLALKQPAPVTVGTLRTDTWSFGWIYLGVLVIVGALTFLPALALGPIGEQLAMNAGVFFH